MQLKRLFALLLLPCYGWCACTTSGSTLTAASASESDVSACVSLLSCSENNLVIPSGSATWTSTLTIAPSGSCTFYITGNGTANSSPTNYTAGTTNTVITDNYASGPMFSITPSQGQTVELSLLDIEPESSSTALWSPISLSGTCNSSGCPYVRLDNIIFGKTTQWTETGNSDNADTMIRSDNVFGVIDHNTLPSGSAVVFANISNSAYLGVGAYGDNAWAQADTFGTGSNLYLENNSIYVGGVSATDAEFAPVGGGIGGGLQVDRFNQVTSNNGFGVFGLHGLDTDGRPRSGRILDVYGNTITCTNSSCNTFCGYRGGTGHCFGNTITRTGSGFFNYFASIAVYRVVFANTPFGYCGGLNSQDPWDTNDNMVYYTGTVTSSGSGQTTFTDSTKSFTSNQLIPSGAPYTVYDTTQGFMSEVSGNTATTITIQGPISESGWTGLNSGDSYEIIRSTVCVDQGGRGQGEYVSGSTPSPSSAIGEALDPIYEWDNAMSPVALDGNVTTDTLRTIANRDWYTDNSDGTPTAQTSATSPFNGSGSSGIGVGFGTLARRPTTCTTGVGYYATDQGSWNTSGNGFGSGILYKCTSTNTWSTLYTPYTYPHPLISGSSPIGSVLPPSNVVGNSVMQ